MPDAWLLCPRPDPQARLRLLCFAYAGGGPPIFHHWAGGLPAGVEVCAVQLPGRGARVREAPFTRLAPLVETLASALRPDLDKPFALFGHSVGALIAFELARALRRRGQPLPAHLFVSGCGAPQLPDPRLPIHALPDGEFVAELAQLGGTPAEVLAHAELMALLLPALRADFALSETYVCAEEPPLACPVTAFGGVDDARVSRDRLEGWREQTVGSFTLRLFPGDHFFINTARPALLEALAGQLEPLLAGVR